MLRLFETAKYKKHIKKYRHNKKLLDSLEAVIWLLRQELSLPPQLKDHELKGKFKGIRELHLQPDTLLLYFTITEDGILKLYDIGTHSDIFK